MSQRANAVSFGNHWEAVRMMVSLAKPTARFQVAALSTWVILACRVAEYELPCS